MVSTSTVRLTSVDSARLTCWGTPFEDPQLTIILGPEMNGPAIRMTAGVLAVIVSCGNKPSSALQMDEVLYRRQCLCERRVPARLAPRGRSQVVIIDFAEPFS